MKILNLYAGIGGNRKLWPKEHTVTAIEINPKIAEIYKHFFPQDTVIVCDAHEYLINNYHQFDFIWSSPPCPTHSRIRYIGTKANHPKTGAEPIKKVYADMTLYQEIIFLTHYFKGMWVVENVKSYYDPLIKPQEIANHYFWSNFIIPKIKTGSRLHSGGIEALQKLKGFDISKFDLSEFKGRRKDQILRNCVEPKTGLHVLNSAFREKQKTLIVKHGGLL